MAGVARFTVSVEPELLERFDAWVAARGFATRSQGARELIRATLTEAAFAAGEGDTWATVTYVYDHHKRDLLESLTHLQHSHLAEVVSTLHVHLDHQHCLEVSVLRGPAAQVRALAERIIATKGVLHGSISATLEQGLLADRAHLHAHDPGHPHAH